MFKKLLLLLFLATPFQIRAAQSFDEKIENTFKPFSDAIFSVIFYSVKIVGLDVPVVLIVLIFGALFFTLYFKFSNIRYLLIAIKATMGKYDKMDHHVGEDMYGDPTPNEGDVFETIAKEGVVGEVTHFQALTAALSATVGLGNIAGVAIAIALGGPGATFWMILAGILGMSTKMVEATLGVKYREVDENGKVYGGPMYYISKGFKERNLTGLGKVLGTIFAIMVVGGSFGAGNMFQSNQATSQFKLLFGFESGFYFGLLMAVLVGIVIIGGIQRIGKVTEKVVPFMGILYVGAAIVILLLNIGLIPEALGIILDSAFNADAALGGVIGVMIVGFQRAAFSNEAGIGSASIAHSSVKTKYPASEGLVASIEPFVDTVVICTMTALVIIITNLKSNLFDYANIDAKGQIIMNSTGKHVGGVDLTSLAFDSVIPNFSILLTVAVILFAFSTMLSWSYYGLQGWKYLFGKGKKADLVYKSMFLIFVVIGASSSLSSVIHFSDAMIFAMVFPNMVGLFLLSPVVSKEIKRYVNAIKEFDESNNDE